MGAGGKRKWRGRHEAPVSDALTHAPKVNNLTSNWLAQAGWRRMLCRAQTLNPKHETLNPTLNPDCAPQTISPPRHRRSTERICDGDFASWTFWSFGQQRAVGLQF